MSDNRPPFVKPPRPVLTPEEEEHERQRCRFLDLPYDPEESYRWRCWAAFKSHNWNLMQLEADRKRQQRKAKKIATD